MDRCIDIPCEDACSGCGTPVSRFVSYTPEPERRVCPCVQARYEQIEREDGEPLANATLYTFGYLSYRSRRVVEELLATSTILLDIRYRPTSKRPEWNYGALLNRYDARQYLDIPELGNERYKEALTGDFQEPHVKLHDPERGMARLRRILSAYGKAAIFCACDTKTCHRFEVARLAREQLGCQIVHL